MIHLQDLIKFKQNIKNRINNIKFEELKFRGSIQRLEKFSFMLKVLDDVVRLIETYLRNE